MPVKAHSKAICVGLRFLADSDRQIDPARWCVAVEGRRNFSSTCRGSPPPGRAAAAKIVIGDSNHNGKVQVSTG